MTKIVLCFDRDYTIDLNPHPLKEAVPLDWVQYFAHNCSITDVWATGNKQLQIEAGLPTVYEAKNLLKKSGYIVTENTRSRIGRLKILHKLYMRTDTQVTFIVVDDTNVRNYTESETNWYYYKPWDFYIEISTIIDKHGLPNPRNNNMSGETYSDTTKHGTYNSLLNRLEEKLE